MSILTSLNAGSGIDTTELIKNLVSAQRLSADKALTARQTKVTAQVSSLATVSSGLSAFSTALGALVDSGALGRQVASSNSTAVAASLVAGGEPTGVAATISVQQLAQKQTVASGPIASRNDPVGQGTLTIAFGTLAADSSNVPTGFTANAARQPVTITIGADQDSLTGLAQAINKANAGVTASIITDGSGQRLVLKGETGATQGFTLSGTGGLSQFDFGPGVTGAASLTTQAKNAKLTIDGIAVERATNSVTDLVDGVKLDLIATTIEDVTITSNFDTPTLSTSLGNYVGAYNEMWKMLTDASKPASSDGAGGPLSGDSAIRDLKNSLSRLTAKVLIPDGGHPATLAEIGIKTNRDGSLTLDSTALAKALNAYPDRVHQMFVPGQSSDSGLVSIASQLGAASPGTYPVTDIVPATGGKLSGRAAPGAFDTPVVIDSTNSGFGVMLDGRNSLSLTLPEGSYASGADLAAAFQTAINNDSVMKSFGLSANVAWDGDRLTFSSGSVGSSSSVVVNGLDPALGAIIGMDVPTSTPGTNVSGKIAGVAAVGIGARLTASTTSAAKGLSLIISSGAATATVTVRSTVSSLITDLQKRLSGDGGGLNAASARLAKEQTAITDAQAKIEEQSTAMTTRLTSQFAAMEKAVAAFKSTQTFLQQQIDAWNGTNN